MRVEEILIEQRSADLYHASKLKYYKEQLNGDFITASTIHRFWRDGVRRERGDPKYDEHVWIKGISMTRSLNFSKKWGPIIYTLDQGALASRYKLLPIMWTKTRIEDEEFLWMNTSIISGDGPAPIRYSDDGKVRLNNLHKYIKHITLVKNFFGGSAHLDNFYIDVKTNVEAYAKKYKIRTSEVEK
jgi:hypothetical protein